MPGILLSFPTTRPLCSGRFFVGALLQGLPGIEGGGNCIADFRQLGGCDGSLPAKAVVRGVLGQGGLNTPQTNAPSTEEYPLVSTALWVVFHRLCRLLMSLYSFCWRDFGLSVEIPSHCCVSYVVGCLREHSCSRAIPQCHSFVVVNSMEGG